MMVPVFIYLFVLLHASTCIFATDEPDSQSVQLTEEEIAGHKTTFSNLDRNQDGLITAEDIKMLLEDMGQNPTEGLIQEKLNDMDTNGDGQITFDEFLAYMSLNKPRVVNEEVSRRAFQSIDKDQDGFISAADLHPFLIKLGAEFTSKEVEQKIREINKDGNLIYEEFVNFMNSIGV